VAAWEALQPVVHAARASGEVLGLMLRGPEALHALADGLAGTAPAEDLAFLRTQAERARALRAAAAVPVLAASGMVAYAASLPQALLSARELEVLALVARGRSNKLIARDLGLSPHTVKRHIARMLERTGLSSRGQLAAWNARA
jgi:LuxR family maltose regulon positive regulatory protein